MSAPPPDRSERRPAPRPSRLARRRGGSAGFRRIHRLKLLTAVLLLAGLSAGLAVFSLVLARADAGFERERLDARLRRQVAAGRSILADDADPAVGADDLARLAGDPGLAGGYPQLYVVELAGRGGHVVLSPRTPFWPGVDVAAVAEDAARARHADAAPYVTGARARRIAPVDAAEPLRVLAWEVPGGGGADGSGAVVVGVATLASGDRSHHQLVTAMWWAGAGVLLFGGCVAVALARGRFWLVDRAVERHEQFLHDTAHELRNPLTTLRAIVAAGLAGDVAPRPALEQALLVIQGTDAVVADLMTLTRIETGRAPLAAEHLRLDLLVEVRARPTVVTANAELVRRAVDNLIENAVRHGRAADKRAEVVVAVGDRRVTVADRGPGVAPALLPHLVERVTTGRRRSGSGLGLAVAGWVARVHGGQLRAANRPDPGGAEFTLELPE